MSSTSATLTFHGGAGTVTGSKYLLTVGDRRLLLDCGLFQGLKPLRERNWQPPAFDPRQITAVVLSHAHLDHCGYLPLLVRHGFRGQIYCTAATEDLVRIVLLDSAHLQEEEAQLANREGFSRHTPALPLYTTDDVYAALRLVVARPYDQPFGIGQEFRVTLRRAGHILGSATIEVSFGQGPTRLVFSGDLGRPSQPILRDPEAVPEADVLLLESTYGDRVHPPNAADGLARVIHEAVGRGGALIVPAFAIGRTQHLLWLLRELEDQGRIPSLPVFIDSPMARQVDTLYEQHHEEHDAGTRELLKQHRDPLATDRLKIVATPQESAALNRMTGPMIIISASGMATGGRVLNHLQARLPDPHTTVLLVGFQAMGTRGRALQEGATEVKIHGEQVPVQARIESLDGLSAHADRDEILAWLGGLRRPPRRTFLVHGEPKPAQALADAIRQRLGWTVDVAQDAQTVRLDEL